MPFAAGVSLHPSAAEAVGEAAGQVLERHGIGPDLALLFTTPHHRGELEDIAGAVRTLLRPSTLLGCVAESVVGNGQEIEDGPGLVVWAGWLGPTAPLHLELHPVGLTEATITGWLDLDALGWQPSALLLLADPFSFPAEQFFAHLAATHPDLRVIGGMASSGPAPVDSVLVCDGDLVSRGAVGALLGPDVAVDAVVSQGCRPIGRPFTVTAAEGRLVTGLGGETPVERLQELANDQLTEEELTILNRGGLQVGHVIDERKVEPGPGDFLVRNILGAGPQPGSFVVDREVEVGEVLQFHLRDPVSADDDMRVLLDGHCADAALVFTCNGRGEGFFGVPNHDAQLVSELLDSPAAAGFFCAGEFGPIGGRNFVHGYTASMALLRDRR